MALYDLSADVVETIRQALNHHKKRWAQEAWERPDSHYPVQVARDVEVAEAALAARHERQVLITVYGGLADEADHPDFDSRGVDVTIWDLDNCEAEGDEQDEPIPDYCAEAAERNWV